MKFPSRLQLSRILLLLGAGSLLLASGCGADTGLVLTIESSYLVPDEIDHLSVEVSGGNQAARTYQVTIASPFPHTMAIDTENITGTLQVTIEAMKGAQVVTQAQIRAELVPDRVLEYFVTL